MNVEDLFQNKKGLFEVGLSNPCEGMSLEEIEGLLEAMTKEGFLEKTPEGGFQLTKKGFKQAKKESEKKRNRN